MQANGKRWEQILAELASVISSTQHGGIVNIINSKYDRAGMHETRLLMLYAAVTSGMLVCRPCTADQQPAREFGSC